ncbi:hypothetical protein JVU11DRAFT_935 [Chiua virens]|nr:hypothetical protein JVU11DRAFT_935 [Chiua virens]
MDTQHIRNSVTNTGPTVAGQPWNNALPVSATYRFSPFDEHLSGLVDTPRWQQDLDRHFTTVFEKRVLSGFPIDSIVVSTLRIIGRPTQAKMRGLALAVHTHWMYMQFRHRNVNESAPEIVALVSRMTDHLGRMSIHAKTDFLDELNCLCIEKLKLSWRWYVDVLVRQVLFIPREYLYTRVIAVVAMIGHLFRGSQFHYHAALSGLRYVAAMSPLTDAVSVTYTLLHQLGPRFVTKETGWQFIQQYLADLAPITDGQAQTHLLCQLVLAIKTLVTEWGNGTDCTILYVSKRNN